jgi:hypothetical protein
VSQQTSNHSFDELTRGLASGSISRGRALRLMGAALLGGTLGSLGGVAAADDECKPLNKKCRKDKQCCSGKCEDSKCAAACVSSDGSCSGDGECCTGLLCDNGKCATCRSNGGPCASHAECCSSPFGGGCRNGTCVESCIQPSLTPCDPNDPSACGAPDSGCNCLPEASSDKTYCRSDVTTTLCTTSCDCPSGQFCEPFGDESFCVAACPGS